MLLSVTVTDLRGSVEANFNNTNLMRLEISSNGCVIVGTSLVYINLKMI